MSSGFMVYTPIYPDLTVGSVCLFFWSTAGVWVAGDGSEAADGAPYSGAVWGDAGWISWKEGISSKDEIPGRVGFIVDWVFF